MERGFLRIYGAELYASTNNRFTSSCTINQNHNTVSNLLSEWVIDWVWVIYWQQQQQQHHVIKHVHTWVCQLAW
jgi:hypothetical protein